ncbi:MAG: nucleotidyltransferase domain-containing protein [Candidatus Heimdallarchaeota archaeon]
MTNATEKFNEIVAECEKDPNVLGLVLSGSQGKGFTTENSDYDFTLIVKDEIIESYKERFDELDKTDDFDIGVSTLNQFREYASWGSGESWDRYSFTHVKATIDKLDGEIQNLIDEKGIIPKDQIKGFIEGHLDGYINGIYRSLKAHRDGYHIAFRYEASLSVIILLDVLFALHDGRLAPYSKYLEYELKKYPLKKLPWTNDEFLTMFLDILDTANYKTQQKIMIVLEKICRKEGYGHVFDSWEGNEKWCMIYEPE